MWNHAPAMWGATARESVTVPAMDEQQAADLFVYFYAAGYFETPGDAKRGKQLFIARRCGNVTGRILRSARAFGRSRNGTRCGTPSP